MYCWRNSLNFRLPLNELSEITGSHYANLENVAEKINKDFEKKSVHKFSTEYKKLRAWLRLAICCLLLEDVVKVPAEIKTAYSHLGEIRDRHLHKESSMIIRL